MTATAMSIALRAELLVYLRDEGAKTGWVLDNTELTEFCEAFGDVLPDTIGADRWDDLRGSIATGLKQGDPVEEAYRDTPFIFTFFQHNKDQSLSMIYEMAHTWLVGSDVFPHWHYVPMVAPAGAEDIYFTFAWVWVEFGAELPELASWTTGTKILVVNPADAFKNLEVEFGPFTPPVDADVSSFLHLHVEREATNILDTYDTNKASGTASANLGLIKADVHFQKSQVGTTVRFP